MCGDKNSLREVQLGAISEKDALNLKLFFAFLLSEVRFGVMGKIRFFRKIAAKLFFHPLHEKPVEGVPGEGAGDSQLGEPDALTNRADRPTHPTPLASTFAAGTSQPCGVGCCPRQAASSRAGGTLLQDVCSVHPDALISCP